jgi:hypothetical protein
LPPATIRDLPGVLALLDYCAAELVAADNSITRAKALITLAGAYTEAIRTGELEQRLAALEAALAERQNGAAHGQS